MKHSVLISIAAIAAALAGCNAGAKSEKVSTGPGERTTGIVEFNLDLPNGESTDTIDLHIECPGISQDHAIDVEAGRAKAAFGGLDGECTVTLTAETDEGTSCAGSETFTVVEDEVLPITVTLTCQGYSANGGGSITVDSDFVIETCTTDRILKIVAIPANVLTGASTTVEVETHPGSVVGTAEFSFAALNDATNTGELSFAAATCAPASAACSQAICDGLGAAPTTDPTTGLPTAGVYVQVTLEDEDCRDTETVFIECVQASECGDGSVEGSEACDDGNTASGDGCNSDCELEGCGDGIVNGTEECDGTAGVGPNQACDITTCQLIDLPYCGNGIVDGDDECDGTAGLLSGQVCEADCDIQPICGNGHVEGTEGCDDGNLVDGDTCSATCTPTAVDPNIACRTCVSTGVIGTDYTEPYCGAVSDPLCAAVLECYVSSQCFATYNTPAECFCGLGADTTACEVATYTTTGPCDDQMRAAAPGATNADILNGMLGFTTLGWAGQIMVEAQSACPAACFF